MKIKSTNGLEIQFLENGAVKSIEAGPVRINLKPASFLSDPGTNLFLRKRGNVPGFHPLTDPGSGSRFLVADGNYISTGSWEGLDYECRLVLDDKRMNWQWQVEVKNNSGEPCELDMVYLQDIGLKPVNAGLLNEYYVAQYLERLIFNDEDFGKVVICRQNMKDATGHPWVMIACRNGAESACTDGMQFYGKTYRETGIPEGLISGSLGGEYAGESPVVAVQERPFVLDPGETHRSVFLGIYLPDHPGASAAADLKMLRLPDEMGFRPKGTPSLGTPSLFPLLPVTDLTETEIEYLFGKDRQHAEIVDDKLLSFFSGNNHIILKNKEILADRPHGHIMQAKAGLVPDEEIMATTAFAFGVFNSHISQGNTNFNVLLSICTSQFNQARESGQRIIVEIEGKKYLLGVPSAFEIGLNHCRWIYKFNDCIYQVRTWTSKSAPQINMDFKIVDSETVKSRVRLWITHDFDPLNKWKIFQGVEDCLYFALPEEDTMIKNKFKDARYKIKIQDNTRFRAGGAELLFPDQRFTGNNLFVLQTEPTGHLSMSVIGEVIKPNDGIVFANVDEQFAKDCSDAWSEWNNLSRGLALISDQKDVAAIREILPWYGTNALTHYLTPYGLEQFGGAAWGTRDVSQGPVDLLLNLGKYKEARQVLLTIFSNQNPDGGWPQWWMFDSYDNIRSDSSHDDIYYWTIIALASYIKTTEDSRILLEELPYYHEDSEKTSEITPLNEHIERLIRMINSSFIPGTSLVPFGGGDWNDSLQPVGKELARRMISSWTVEMNYQAFRQYQAVCRMTGQERMADRLDEICLKIRSDFNKYLVKDGIVAGYGLLEDDGSISVMLHPSDTRTGIRLSILPMERGILSGIFTREQAEHHLEIIEKHLKGPDGVRLMDRPLKYKGGIQEIFHRAESSTFFGREIGLMYVHEHIRYAEALAKMGRADAFVVALRQAIPVDYRSIVPMGDIRQANCYYSSSDVHFKTRYEADERYNEVIEGSFTLRGGWRVYSSGPGIYIGLVISRLLGIRIEWGNVIFDPVLPFSMDGLSASMDFMGKKVTFNYSVKEENFGPKAIRINGQEISTFNEDNIFRQGGAVIPVKILDEILTKDFNLIEVLL